MANQVKVRPWVIDTVGSTVIYTPKLKIDHIDYVGYTDPAHQVEIQDKNGNTIALLKGGSDLSVITSYPCVDWVDGLLVPSTVGSAFGSTPNMQSGVAIVYVL